MARGAFWTIIVDDQPTAFRAPVREDLLPTLKQLQRQTPTATIKWFQRGRLWETPGDAMDAHKPPRRGAGWRPGGEHKDPREQYKVPRDVKRARWASQAAEGRGPWVKTGTQEHRSTGAQGNDQRRTPKQEHRNAGAQEHRAGGQERRKTGAWGDAERRTSNADSRRGRSEPASPKLRSEGGLGAPKPRGEGGPKPTGGGGWTPKGPRTPNAERRTPKQEHRAGGQERRKTGSRGNAERRTPNAEGRAEWRKPGAPVSPKPRGEGGWTPKGPRTPNVERRTSNADWRGDRATRRDATPRSGGDFKPAPKAGWPPRSSDAKTDRRPVAKAGRTWRAGELPPADRKKKKKSDES